jgi:hypothetical protein
MVKLLRRNGAFSAFTPILCVAALVLAPGTATGAPPGTPLDPALCAPDQNTFSLNIDNAYFPLPVGRVWVYTGKEQGQTIGLRITVLDETERFYSGQDTIITRVVEELEWEDADGDGVVDDDEFVIEVSRNYYAQTQDGTVCYFGEDVDIFNEDGTVTHEGAWRADDPGNAPGIFMPAAPERGMTFQQEVAPGVAEDLATITKVGKTTITVRDFNPLDGSSGTKVYEQGIGLIQDGPLRLISVTG